MIKRKKVLRSPIARNIFLCRHKASLTQRQVAELIGVGNTMMSNFETGNRRVPRPILERLAAIYGVSVESLSSFDAPLVAQAEVDVHPPQTLSDRNAVDKLLDTLTTLSAPNLDKVARLINLVVDMFVSAKEADK